MAIGLKRTAPRLLRTVANKPHATQDDHDELLPTPPATNSTRSSASNMKPAHEDEEDVMRDPESSEDEASKPLPTAQEDAASNLPARPTWKMPKGVQSPQSTRSKRSHDSDEHSSSDTGNEIFGSQDNKRQKSSAFQNIHAAPHPLFQHPARSKVKYGSKGRQQRPSPRKEFQKPEKKAEEVVVRPTFKRADIKPPPDLFLFGASQDATLPGAAGASGSLSPSLSSLSSAPDSPDVEEIQQLDLPAPVPYCARTACPICGEQVEQRLKENFEDQFTRGRPLTYRWQQRFCTYHQQHDARERWTSKNYPDIDWENLKKGRLTAFDEHLRKVLNGKVSSTWRDELNKQMKTSRSKTVMQTIAADQGDKAKSSVGYYGPRGEKVMYVLISAQHDLLQANSFTGPITSLAGFRTTCETARAKTSSWRHPAFLEACRGSYRACSFPNLLASSLQRTCGSRCETLGRLCAKAPKWVSC